MTLIVHSVVGPERPACLVLRRLGHDVIDQLLAGREHVTRHIRGFLGGKCNRTAACQQRQSNQQADGTN